MDVDVDVDIDMDAVRRRAEMAEQGIASSSQILFFYGMSAKDPRL